MGPAITLLLLDLDDTLLDTSNLLAPAAHRSAVKAMQSAGMPGTTVDLLAERLALSRTVPPDALSREQARIRGCETEAIVEAGDRAYFDREVPPLALERGVEDMLRRVAAPGRSLVLVTSGVERTQRAKVERLGLGWLDAHVYVPVGGWEVKEGELAAQAAARGIDPRACVVVGDRLDSEILAGNHLGMWTIHIDRGEGGRRALGGEVGRADVTVDGPLGIEGAVATLEEALRKGGRPGG